MNSNPGAQEPAGADQTKSTRNVEKPALGLAAAIVVVFVWSGWLIVTKIGADSTLTIFDIAALRFGISALVALPIVIYFKPWQGMPLYRIVVLAILAGVPYVLISYSAFLFAPAAYGGVFMNGILPALTLALAWLFLKERPRWLQIGGSALIILGAVLAAIDASGSAASGAWIGILLFLLAASIFSAYLILNRLWQVTIPQLLLSLSVISGFVYVPIWALFLPSALGETATGVILLQAGYQILPNLVGLNLLAFAVRHVGASATAAVMSAVPSVGAILGFLILGERLGPVTWVGIVILSLGILLTAVRPRRSS